MRGRCGRLLTLAWVVAPVVLPLGAPALGQGAKAAAPELGRWERLDPPVAGGGVTDLAAEPEGPVWVMAGGRVYYRRGGKFTEPATAELRSGMVLARFVGGGDRDLYVTQPGDKEHRGKLYKCAGGDATFVADFYYDASYEPPGVHVSRAGKLYNWGRRFVAVFSNGTWVRKETKLGGARYTRVFDAGETVYFHYNGRIVSVNAKDEFDERQIFDAAKAGRDPRNAHAAVFGKDRLVTFQDGKSGLGAFDLKTYKAAPSEAVSALLGKRRLHDAFRLRDGSVWVQARDVRASGYSFCRIAPDGTARMLNETGRIGWDSSRRRQYPRSVAMMRDGSVWFALPRGDVARWQDGAVRVFGWKDGLTVTSHLLAEDAAGKVYAAGAKALYVYDPKRPPGPPPADVALWQEHIVSSHVPVRDGLGYVWMCLKDHPNNISRWDGRRFLHVGAPFPNRQISRMVADDRGHLLVQGHGYYVVGPKRARKYERYEDLFAAAVRDGARRFSADANLQGCVVLDDGRIWLGYRGHSTLNYYDGESWDPFHMQNGITGLFESGRHGMVLMTYRKEYYTYDRGWIVPVTVDASADAVWLMGLSGVQPYERELHEKHPRHYVPVRKIGDRYRLLGPSSGSVKDQEVQFTDGPMLPHGFNAVRPDGWGGSWPAQPIRGARLFRIFANQLIELDVEKTPLAGKAGLRGGVFEDRERNIVVDGGEYSGVRHVFVKRLDTFNLKLGDIPDVVGKSVQVTATSDMPGLDKGKLRLFWRLGSGAWRGGQTGGKATVEFPRDGTYEIEFVGMGPQGGMTPKTVKATVTSKAGAR